MKELDGLEVQKQSIALSEQSMKLACAQFIVAQFQPAADKPPVYQVALDFIKKALAVLLLALFVPSFANAQCKNLFQRQVVQHYVAPVYAQQLVAYVPHYQNQQVRYFLGEDLQVEALAEKLAPKLAPLVAQHLQRLNAIPPATNGNGHQPPPVDNGGGLSIRQGMPLFTARCARCHTGDNPSSGISFDAGMSNESFRKFVIMFQSNTFPKPMQFIANMTPQEKGAITEEVGKFGFTITGNGKAEVVPPPKPNPPDDGELK